MSTQRANPFAIAFVVLAAAAAVVVWWGPWRTPEEHQHQDTKPLTDEDIQRRRTDLAGRVARYAPAKPADINELAAPLVSILRGLPGVVRVDATPVTSKPGRRIVHVLDWHFVPKDLVRPGLVRLPGFDAEGLPKSPLLRFLLVWLTAEDAEQ